MHRIIVLLATCSIALGLALPAASAAVPTSASGGDPSGDAAAPKGDIVAWSIKRATRSSQLGVQVKVNLARGSDPVTSPLWHNTDTQIRTFLDTTATHVGADYVVTIFAAGTSAPFEFAVTILDVSGDPFPVKCAFSAGFASPAAYRVFVPFNCLGAPLTTRARFEMTLDRPPLGGIEGVDRAPNSGWSPVIDTTTP